MEKRFAVKSLCLALALILALFAFSACKAGETPPTFEQADMAELAPSTYDIQIPTMLYKDIDDIDLTTYEYMSTNKQEADNGDGTTSTLTVTSYYNGELHITVDITADASGEFCYGNVYYANLDEVMIASANYSAPYKELTEVRFDNKTEEHETWSKYSYITAYFDDEVFKHAVYSYTINSISDGVYAPIYNSSAVYTTKGELAASYVSVTGEAELRYYDETHEPVTPTIYSILVTSIQYKDYLLPDEKTASYAAEKLNVTLPEGLTNEFSEFVKTDDYVLTDTKANYYGDDLKDDSGIQFNTTTTFYKNETNGYTVEMTMVDESDYLFIANVKCENPHFSVIYREDGILDAYIDYDNNTQYSCYYNSDFTPAYYSMAYSMYCGTNSDATANIICDYNTDNTLLRYCVDYSFGLTIYFDATNTMIEDDEFDLLNPLADYQ